MPTLVEIAEREQVVLFDSSTIGLEAFSDSIYRARKYADLDRNLLSNAQEVIKGFLKFIENRNTFTVEEALQDFTDLQHVISTKQRHLNISQKGKSQRSNERGEQKQLLFSEISTDIYEISRLVRFKLFVPDKDVYDTLYDAIYDAIQSFLKQTSIKLSPKDRQLYAAAFYLSSYQKMSVALIVRGIDFEKGLISLVERIPRMRLQQFPIKLYFDRAPNGYDIIYTTQK